MLLRLRQLSACSALAPRHGSSGSSSPRVMARLEVGVLAIRITDRVVLSWSASNGRW